MAEELRDALSAEARRDKSKLDGGAALVTAEMYSDFIRLWHAGDCRGYLFKPEGGVLTQLTEDHTLRAELIKAEQVAGKKLAAELSTRTTGRLAIRLKTCSCSHPIAMRLNRPPACRR